MASGWLHPTDVPRARGSPADDDRRCRMTAREEGARMAAIDTGSTLADLVTANPAMAASLDHLGLDYCCGGQRRLIDAVNDADLDLGEVVSTLAVVDSAPPTVDWSTMGIGDLADHLETTHHAYLREALPRLVALSEKVAGVHGDRHPELADVQRLVAELRADLGPHLAKEEALLFPMARGWRGEGAAPTSHPESLAATIRVLISEHDVIGRLLAEVREVAEDYTVPADGCASYQALYSGLAELELDTHLHVHKENNLLFPAVTATGEPDQP
jgi:regulator of cell morphogenesis and NO signaling